MPTVVLGRGAVGSTRVDLVVVGADVAGGVVVLVVEVLVLVVVLVVVAGAVVVVAGASVVVEGRGGAVVVVGPRS